MTERQLNWSVVVPWLITVATVGVGIWQFSVQQGQANRQPFLQKQLELGFLATETAATLSSETDPVKWEEARSTFWRLYWGPLSIVEDRAVESAMVQLGQLIPDKPDPTAQLPMAELEGPSYKLAHAVRGLILSSWKVDLPALQPE